MRKTIFTVALSIAIVFSALAFSVEKAPAQNLQAYTCTVNFIGTSPTTGGVTGAWIAVTTTDNVTFNVVFPPAQASAFLAVALTAVSLNKQVVISAVDTTNYGTCYSIGLYNL